MVLYKKWILRLWFGTICLMFIVALLNYLFDPYWCFSHTNIFTRKQKGFDERQQKTNRITFQSKKYDALLIGDSMVSFINQNDFADLKVYNYGLSGGSIKEYGDYIEYAKKKNGSDFRFIFLGISLLNDFTEFQETIHSPSFYIAECNSFLYRYRLLFRGYTLKQSIKNLRLLFGDMGDDYYDRNNVRFFRHLSKSESESIFRLVLSDPLKYDRTNRREFINALRNIKLNNPQTKIIAFIPPKSHLLFRERYVKAMGLNHYAKLLEDCLSILDSLYTFMYPNSITLNVDNFYDLGHFYPNVGKLIAHRLVGIEDQRMPADFGRLLVKKNVQDHLVYLEKQLQDLRVSFPFK